MTPDVVHDSEMIDDVDANDALEDDDNDGNNNDNINDHTGINSNNDTASLKNVKSISKPTRMKCQKCNIRFGKEGCIHQWCSQCCIVDDDCVVHQKQRAMSLWKDQVLMGTTPIQLQAQERRKLRIRIGSGMESINNATCCTATSSTPTTNSNHKRKRNFFYEPNFVYQGDTIVIWDIQEYITNPDSDLIINDAVRKSKRRNKFVVPTHGSSPTAAMAAPRLLRNHRVRFRRIMNDLYVAATNNNNNNNTHESQRFE